MRLTPSTIAAALVAETQAPPLVVRRALRAAASILSRSELDRALRTLTVAPPLRTTLLARVASAAADAAGAPGIAPALARTLALLVTSPRGLRAIDAVSGELARTARRTGTHLCRATTSALLPPDAVSRLSAGLARWTGGTVDIEVEVDPTVLGGLRLELDGSTLDHTFSARLATLRAAPTP